MDSLSEVITNVTNDKVFRCGIKICANGVELEENVQTLTLVGYIKKNNLPNSSDDEYLFSEDLNFDKKVLYIDYGGGGKFIINKADERTEVEVGSVCVVQLGYEVGNLQSSDLPSLLTPGLLKF